MAEHQTRVDDPDSVHDVLAAEEFVVPAPDPGLEPAHDVLAAEEFGMPAPDPELHHHGPIHVPEDPLGIAEPHDVLAADEFPMPAPRQASSLIRREDGAWHGQRLLAIGALVLLALRLIRRRRRG